MVFCYSQLRETNKTLQIEKLSKADKCLWTFFNKIALTKIFYFISLFEYLSSTHNWYLCVSISCSQMSVSQHLGSTNSATKRFFWPTSLFKMAVIKRTECVKKEQDYCSYETQLLTGLSAQINFLMNYYEGTFYCHGKKLAYERT